MSAESDEQYLDRAEAVSFIHDAVEEFPFDPETESANYDFAYNVAHWVAMNFDDYAAAPKDPATTRQLPVISSSQFDGSELPAAIQSLLLQGFGGQPDPSDENQVDMSIRPDCQYFPPEFKSLGDIEDRKRYPTLALLIKAATTYPDLLEGLVPPRYIFFEKIELRFRPASWCGWGLHFDLQPTDINASPFGQAGCTREATEFVLGNATRSDVMAKTVCQLSVLAATHRRASMPLKLPSDIRESFIAWITGEQHRKLPELRLEQHSNIGEVLLRELIVREIITKDDLIEATLRNANKF